jgi:hypothetical protein
MVFAFFHILPNSSFLITVINSSIIFLKREVLRCEKEKEKSYTEISKYVLYYWKVWYAMTVLYVFVQTFLFLWKGGPLCHTIACTDKRRSYIIIHVPSALVCENLLYRTFVTYATFCFLGLYTWMSSSQKWWHQSFKYGNDWHLINMFVCIFNQNI